MDRLAASIAVALRVDLGNLRLIVPIRLAIAVVIPLVIGMTLDRLSLGVSAAMGAFICGVSDSGDTFPVRARVMLVTSVALALTATVGGLVSESMTAVVAVSAVVAFLCGYLAVFGPNASLTGTLALVMYVLFAGAAVGEDAALAQGVAVLVGALLQTALSLSAWPFRRCSGVRGQLADTWRTLAVLSSGKPRDLLSPLLPGQLVHTATEIAWSGTQGKTRDWLQNILVAAQTLRLPLASIASRRLELEERDPGCQELADLDDFAHAVSRFSRAMARGLVVLYRSRALPAALEDVRSASRIARAWAPAQVDAVTAACEAAAEQMTKPYPIGRRGLVTYRLNMGSPRWSEAVKRDFTLDSPILRHSIRMAIIIPVAWIVGLWALTEHQYWVALTVAWVTRPGYGVTVGRVVSRTGGTLIGLALVGLIIWVTSPGPWGLIVICAISSYILFAAMPVNYAFAVIFVTSLIVTMLDLSGDDLISSLSNRGIGTILGGVIALIASQIGAQWAGPTLPTKLVSVAIGIRRYADASFDNQDDLRASIIELVNARREAAHAIQDATLEPKKGNLEPARAERVLNALLACIFAISAVDSPVERKAFNHPIDTAELDRELIELGKRLHAIDDGTQPESAGPMPQVQITDPRFGSDVDPACLAVKRAIAYL